MKKLLLILTGLFALILGGCQKDTRNSEDANKKYTIRVTSDSPQSKVAVDRLSVKWSAGDYITVFEVLDDNKVATQKRFEIDPNSISGDGKSANFIGDELTEGKKYMAVHSPVSLTVEGGFAGLIKKEAGLADLTQKGAITNDHIGENVLMMSNHQVIGKDAPIFVFDHKTAVVQVSILLADQVYDQHKIKSLSLIGSNKCFLTGSYFDALGSKKVDDGMKSDVLQLFFADDIYLSQANKIGAQFLVMWNSEVLSIENVFKFKVTTQDNRVAIFERPAKVLTAGKFYEMDMVIDELKAESEYLNLSKNEAQIGHNGGKLTIDVDANIEYKMAIPPLVNTWIRFVGSVKNGTVTTYEYEISPNEGVKSRAGTIEFMSPKISKTFNVFQDDKSSILTLSASSAEARGDQGFVEMTLETSAEAWAVSNVPLWMSVSPENGNSGTHKLKISHQANLSSQNRSAVITFSADGQAKTFTLNQPVLSLTLSRDNYGAGQVAGSFSVAVNTTSSQWETTGVPLWVTLSKGSGTQTLEDITVNYTQNPTSIKRTAEIVFTTGDVSKTLTITQDAKPELLTISLDNYSATKEAGVVKLLLEAYYNWSVEDVPEWVTVSPTSGGSGKYDIAIGYQANTEVVDRVAVLKFKAGSVVKEFTLTQAESKFIEIIKTEYKVTYSGGEISVELKSNTEFTTAIDVDWIEEVGQTKSEVTNTTLKFSVGKNETTATRKGKITFNGGGVTAVVNVSQSDSGNVDVTIDGWQDDGDDHGGDAS